MWLVCVVWVLLLSTAFADIDIKPQYDVHEPIVATVSVTDVPALARLRGSFSVSDGNYLAAGENVFHVWAGPGKHTVRSQGVWVLTKDIVVEGQTIPVLIDFGSYTYEKSFIVGGDVPPPFPPEPPPTPGLRRGVILEESAERTPAFGFLRQQLLRVYPPEKLQILDDDLPLAAPYLPLVKPAVRPVLLVLEGDRLIRAVACPSSVSDVTKELTR